jgi:elongation factor G
MKQILNPVANAIRKRQLLQRLSPITTSSSNGNKSQYFSRFNTLQQQQQQQQQEKKETQLDYLTPKQIESLSKLRNIGISAHIDSGKTTLTERILFYTGRIDKIHEVRGSDNVGAKMDSMELEREKGITIKSAATHCKWRSHHINIIDTPGHVDFTIEVERSLRVLDGAILILCAVSGVQSQSLTVDRQMKRYGVPRLVFINKLDRMGADPERVLKQARQKLGLNAAQVQVPIGLEDALVGLVDIIEMKTIKFLGANGENVVVEDTIPDRVKEEVRAKRKELIEAVAEFDEEVQMLYLEEKEPDAALLKKAIRRGVLANKFAPVFLGTAKKNLGVQTLLDGVVDYLPNPAEINNYALRQVIVNEGDENDQDSKKEVQRREEKVLTISDPEKPFLGLAFKLEESKYGQLTYIRVYQGSMKRGTNIYNMTTKEKVKVPRLVRMHADEMEDIDEIGPGEICAMFGIECASGDTFVGSLRPENAMSMESMFVPEPVISLSLTLLDKAKEAVFAKALARFQREDPTFKVTFDSEGGQTIISGMGELHLQIYTERMKREYDLNVVTGRPYVAYREAINMRALYDYTHKKQTGGAGQYAKVIGYIEPIPVDQEEKFEFVNKIIGNVISPGYIAACDKGFREAVQKGPLIGCPVWGVRVALTDGNTHPVDSSELAFRLACLYAFKQAFQNAKPSLIEPIMRVEVACPSEFQGSVMGSISKRRGQVVHTEVTIDTTYLTAEVPLADMFGYTTDLRSLTQGKGEFSMDYLCHRPVTPDIQNRIIKEYQMKQSGKKVSEEEEKNAKGKAGKKK